MRARERQEGFVYGLPSLPFFFIALGVLNTVLSGKKLSEKFAERQKKNDLIVLAPVIYESLLRNPALGNTMMMIMMMIILLRPSNQSVLIGRMI